MLLENRCGHLGSLGKAMRHGVIGVWNESVWRYRDAPTHHSKIWPTRSLTLKQGQAASP